ncbi:MAG TPA: DinB family protein [Roseiflexaceae bacterium]|nr:DinB family protein [Roseiflexaceae bacterium]
MGTRSEALAARVEQGAQTLIAFVEGRTDAEWQTVCTDDGRTVGVLVHHIATALLAEAEAVKLLADGKAIAGLTWAVVDQANAQHASQHSHTSQHEAVELLRHNSAIAAETIRALSDEQLDLAAPNSLHADAPMTTQFWIENHPLAHAYRHLASIRAAISSL